MPIETISYAGWNRCLRLFNGKVEAVVTTDVGPRILRFGAVGRANLLHEVPAHRGLAGGSTWRSYGGHRLWHAPEVKPRTYSPDNDSVPFEIAGDVVRLTQAVEADTGIQKQMEIRLNPAEPRLHVLHRLTNRNPWAVELAPWSITMMAPGGVAIVPQEPFGPHPDDARSKSGAGTPSYLPVRNLALWSYTRLDDTRWRFLERFILMRQDSRSSAPIKFGVSNRQGWCAYAKEGELFLKRFPWVEGGRYPDLGCSAEIYTDADMLEVESLGPLVILQPGEGVDHAEEWSYLQDERISPGNQSFDSVFPGIVDSMLS